MQIYRIPRLFFLLLIYPTFILGATSPLCPDVEGEYQAEGGFISNAVKLEGEHKFKVSKDSAICGGAFRNGELTISGNVVIKYGAFQGKNAISGNFLLEKYVVLNGGNSFSGDATLNHGFYQDVIKKFEGVNPFHPSARLSPRIPPLPENFVAKPILVPERPTTWSKP